MKFYNILLNEFQNELNEERDNDDDIFIIIIIIHIITIFIYQTHVT